jgi:hypothetical protein
MARLRASYAEKKQTTAGKMIMKTKKIERIRQGASSGLSDNRNDLLEKAARMTADIIWRINNGEDMNIDPLEKIINALGLRTKD